MDDGGPGTGGRGVAGAAFFRMRYMAAVARFPGTHVLILYEELKTTTKLILRTTCTLTHIKLRTLRTRHSSTHLPRMTVS